MPPHEGLTHLKEYDVKDSNVELIGTDIDHRVKYNSAATEPAWNNGTIGQTSCLYIWRIEDFSVISWPSSKTGSFYSGDSYIILHSYNLGHSRDGNEKLGHDIFFWLGSKTTQDEAGTAAYKTVELDEFLGGAATQHREVQQQPSSEFLSLFPNGIRILSGGVRSGFRHVTPGAADIPMTLLRVFKLPGTWSIVVHEVEPTWHSLDEDDVFILEKDEKIWVWQGKNASPLEKGRAALVVGDMVDAKHIDVEVLAQTESRSRVIVGFLGGADNDIQKTREFKAARPITNDQSNGAGTRTRKLFRISDDSGRVSFDLVKDGEMIGREDLDSNDVFLFDTESTVWVWRGSGASKRERALWIQVSKAYVRQIADDAGSEEGEAHLTPVKTVAEGNESEAFWKALEG